MRAHLLGAVLLLAIQAGAAEPPAAWKAWPGLRVSPADPWSLRHAGLRARLEALQARHPGLFSVDAEGLSAEGRKIPLLRVGEGPVPVLLWSQMHGDEPTATSALLDLLNWMGTERERPEVRQLRARLTLWIVPMLNPDGTERGQRRNAQEIDINRDALRLASPEGRFLKAVRDRVRPELGFNLHNQNPNYPAGAGGPQAALSVLAVPGDPADSLTPGTRRTRQLAVRVQRSVDAVAPGRTGRYDSGYTERAFGDSMTRWGTPTLLIETGGWHGPGEAERLVRLNFTVLAEAFAAIADGSLEAIDPAVYGRIPRNGRDRLLALVLRGVRVASGRGLPPFRADLGFTKPGLFRGDDANGREPAVAEVGDFDHGHGLVELAGPDLLAVPWPGATPDWASLSAGLRDRGLDQVEEAVLLAAVRALGEPAVAGPGYSGPVLLYRELGQGRLRLAGAVLAGQLAGDLEAAATAH